jgi:hypothetical protein
VSCCEGITVMFISGQMGVRREFHAFSAAFLNLYLITLVSSSFWREVIFLLKFI